MTSWWTALRIARRQLRRAKGRSTLVVALIGLPVLALSFTAASYDMFTLTDQERLDRQLGTADAQLRWVADEPVRQIDLAGTGFVADAEQPAPPPAHTAADLLALLPPGSQVTPRSQGSVRVDTATGSRMLDWQALDLTDPLTRGIARVTDGRAPRGAGEVAVTPVAARRLGVAIGDQIELPEPDRYEVVVGLVEFPGLPGSGPVAGQLPSLSGSVLVFHPAARPTGRPQLRWLASTGGPVSWEQVQELNRHGVLVQSRAVAQDPPANLAAGPATDLLPTDLPAFQVGVVIAGLSVLEIVLLAGPAFAVGARRRRRELALVAAGGATPAQLRRIVLADGVLLGTLGAAIGLALGVAGALGARPLVEAYLFDARAGGYRVFPLALAATVALAIGTGVLAALVPAVTAARQPVVAGLAGRRGTARSRKRWVALGLAMLGLGTAATGLGAWRVSAHTVLAGLVLGQLGLVLCTPALVGLVARMAARLPLAPRIALRDTARNRAAAAPAISAVMAAVAGSVTTGVVVLAMWGQDQLDHVPYAPGTGLVSHGVWAGPEAPSRAAVERAARQTLPVAEVYREWTVECPVEPSGAGSGCRPLAALVPPPKVCPYWQAHREGPLSAAEQRAAAGDPHCRDGGSPFGLGVSIDDGSALVALTDAEPAALAEAARVLRAGGAVVTDPRYLGARGRVTLGQLDPASFAPGEVGRFSVPGYLLDTDLPRRGAIVSPEPVRAAGLPLAPAGLLVATTRMPTEAEQDAFAAAMADLGTWGEVSRVPDTGQVDAGLALLAAAAGLVALGAAGIATGLAAADRRTDLSTLGAVGASPRVRRLLSLSQTGMVAGLGTGLGLLAGLGGAAAVLVGLNQRYAGTWPAPDPYPISAPVPNLAVLLAVPLVAMLGAGLLTRSRLPIERRL